MGNLGGLLHDECPSSTRQARPSHQNTHSKVLAGNCPDLIPCPLKTGEEACPTYGRALGSCSPAYQYPWSGGWGGGGVF